MTRHDFCRLESCGAELTEIAQQLSGFCDDGCESAYGPQCGVCGDSGWVDRIEGDVSYQRACTRCEAGREQRESGKDFQWKRESAFWDAISGRR